MTSSHGIALLALLSCLGCARSNAAPAHPERDGLLLLGDDIVLAWSSAGSIETGTVERGLGAPIQLPLSYVVEAGVDQDGALFAGSLALPGQEDLARVVKTNAQGKVLETWELGAGVAGSVQSSAETRLATGFQGVVVLEPGSRAVLLLPAPPRARLRLGPSASILCHPANRTLSDARPASCGSLSRAESSWDAPGVWTRTPLLCGSWLVEPSETSARVRAAVDGTPAAEILYEKGAILACGVGDSLLVGHQDLRLLSLPSGAPLEQLPCGASGVALLAVRESAAVCMDHQGSLHPLQLPSPPSP